MSKIDKSKRTLPPCEWSVPLSWKTWQITSVLQSRWTGGLGFPDRGRWVCGKTAWRVAGEAKAIWQVCILIFDSFLGRSVPFWDDFCWFFWSENIGESETVLVPSAGAAASEDDGPAVRPFVPWAHLKSDHPDDHTVDGRNPANHLGCTKPCK